MPIFTHDHPRHTSSPAHVGKPNVSKPPSILFNKQNRVGARLEIDRNCDFNFDSNSAIADEESLTRSFLEHLANVCSSYKDGKRWKRSRSIVQVDISISSQVSTLNFLGSPWLKEMPDLSDLSQPGWLNTMAPRTFSTAGHSRGHSLQAMDDDFSARITHGFSCNHGYQPLIISMVGIR